MARMQAAAFALVVTLSAIAGCGGSSSSSSSSKSATSKPLTQTELIAQADRVCGRINAKINYYSNLKPSNSKDLVSIPAVVRAAPQVAALESSAQASLAQLNPPANIAGDWQQIVSGVKRLSENTRRFGAVIQASNAASTEALVSSTMVTLHQIHTTAARDGLVDCAKLVQPE